MTRLLLVLLTGLALIGFGAGCGGEKAEDRNKNSYKDKPLPKKNAENDS
jgi:hypothetical protein